MNKYLLAGVTAIWVIFSGSALASGWPEWLGESVRSSVSGGWDVQAQTEFVDIKPKNEHPIIWVIVSRKAKSYDTAIETILNLYKQELGSAAFRVFKLPGDNGLLDDLLTEAEGTADLIYTVGSKATVAVRKQYAGGQLPVVSVNAKDPVQLGLIDSYDGSNDNFAFTSLNLPADVTLSFLLRYLPHLDQLGVLYAKNNTSSYLTQYLPLKKEAESKGIKVLALEVDEDSKDQTLNLVMESSLSEMRNADPKLERSLLWLTGSSSLLARVDEINQLAGAMPLLTVVPEAVSGDDDSALMSVGVSFVNNAHQAALYGIKIIKEDVDPGSLPVGVISPPDISISFRQAQRIGKPVPFILMEMASDIYASDGRTIRSQGMSMENSGNGK